MTKLRTPSFLLWALLGVLCASAFIATAGCATEQPVVRRALTNPPHAYLLHLPGIGGYRGIDRRMLQGLRDGGFEGEIEPYDWTENDPGLAALLADQRHKIEAKKVSN